MTATTYTVGATFKVIDEASPALRIISEGFAKLDAASKKLQERFDLLGKFKFGSLEAALGGVGVKLDEITKQGDGTQLKLREIADTRFSGLNRGLTGIASRLGKIEAQAKLAGSALNGLPQLPAPGGGGGGNRHPRPGQSGGHGNTYGRHGVGVDAGIFGFLGFEAMKGGVEATLHRGMELAHVQEQMRQAGISQGDIDRATGSSWQQARAYGLDVSKVLGDVKELTLPFGSVDHAIEFIDPLERMRVVLNAVSEGRGNSSADAVYAMARAGELKGLQNPEDYLHYFDGMTKAISASGGKVTPQAFAQATQYGKLASFGWGEDFYTRSLPTMIQSMNPSTAGQSLMSLFSTLSGQVSQKAFGNIQDLGLISDPSKIVHTKTGIQFKPGAIKGYEEFVSNPLAWAKDVLDPLLEGKYGDLGDAANKEKAIGELQGLFGNRNSAAAVAELALRSKSFDKDAALIDKARGIDGAKALLDHDPTTAMANFTAAWTNMLTALGGPAVKPATDMLNGLSGAMNKVGEFAQAHPNLAKQLEGIAGGIAVGLGGLAILGLAAFAPGGAIAIGAFTLAGAIGGILAVNWDAIKTSIGKLPAILDEVTGFFSALGDKLLTAIHGFFAAIISKLQSLPGIGRFFGSGADGGLAHPTAFETWDDPSPFAAGNTAALTGTTGGNFLPGAPSSAVDTALKLQGLGSGGAASALGAHMTNGEWCADFVNGALAAHGIKGSGSSAALSFSHWGQGVDVARAAKGDVAFENHGGGHGHAMLLTGEHDKRGWLGVVAGNSGGRVKRYWENPAKLAGIRRAIPARRPPPAQTGHDIVADARQPDVHIHLDGKKIAHVVGRQMASAATYAHSVGGRDTHAHWPAPGDTLMDAG